MARMKGSAFQLTKLVEKVADAGICLEYPFSDQTGNVELQTRDDILR